MEESASANFSLDTVEVKQESVWNFGSEKKLIRENQLEVNVSGGFLLLL